MYTYSGNNNNNDNDNNNNNNNKTLRKGIDERVNIVFPIFPKKVSFYG